MARFSSSATRSNMLVLRKKKKTMAEVVNEQLDPSIPSDDGHDDGHFGDANGVAESYEWGEDDSNNYSGSEEDYAPAAARSSSSGASKKSNNNNAMKRSRSEGDDKRLRRRGPLDASFAEGKYAAAPVNVEDTMDDIFGTLDMGDLDAEADELYSDGGDDDFSLPDEGEEDEDAFDEEEEDDEDAAGRKKAKGKGKKAKDLSEEEYAEWLEKRREKRRATRKLSGMPSGLDNLGGSMGGEEEGLILAQLEGLRQANMKLINDDGDAQAGDAQAKARERTQEAVRHYVMLYAQLLRIRVKLQPAVTKAVSMPQYYAYSMFQDSSSEHADDADAIADSYKDVRAELADVLAAVYAFATKTGEDDSESGPAAKRKKTEASSSKLSTPTFKQIQKFHSNIISKANTCLEHWGSKLVQANSAKLQTIAQPLPQQIAAILAVKSRLLGKVQKNRGHLPIMAHPDHERCASSVEAKTKRAAQVANGDMDEEIYDDSDFLRELVRRGGAVASRLEAQLANMNKELMPAKDAAKKGFHRLTKGKTVSYDPRPKIVGFLMPHGYDNSGRNDIVFKSIFQ